MAHRATTSSEYFIFNELEVFELCSLSTQTSYDGVKRRKRLVVSFETSHIFDFSYHPMVVGVDVLLKDVHFQ